MRLIINAIPLLGEEGGIGNYTRQIAAAIMANTDYDVTLFYGYPSKKLVGLPESGGVLSSLKGLATKSSPIRRVAKKILPLSYRLMNAAIPRTWDCYFEPNFALLPTIRAARRVITVHDFSCFRYPQWHPQDRVAHMGRNLWPSVVKASHIITASDCIRREAIDCYGINPDFVTAIPHGVNHDIFHPSTQAEMAALRQRYDLPPHFILHVGALEPRKNLANLILAHAQLPQDLRRHFPLLLIGPSGWNNEQILNLIERNAPYTRLLGQVPLKDLPHFYSLCELFVYPSWYEGFGLPVLEAMACGRPVLASTADALMELSAGAAAHTPPQDVDAMTAKLRQLLEDKALREQMETASAARARQFNWNVSAVEHMRLFQRLVEQC